MYKTASALRIQYRSKQLFHTTTHQFQKKFTPGFFTSLLSNEQETKEILTSFPHLSAKEASASKQPLTQIKMLTRDFIEDSLYNPHYGFYSKAPIAPAMEFEEMEQEEDHIKYMRRLAKSHGKSKHQHIHQSRYTLTELFKPWYGYAIAKYMVTEYKLNLYPHKDLIIYEMGGWNGRLMPHILNYIERYEPSVYKRTQYNMIELSDRAVSPSFMEQKSLPKHGCVQILNQNMFEWDKLISEQCFFLGMEVMNHFPHDVIRYNLDTLMPYQGVVCVDKNRNYTELFEPIGSDSLISRYLALRDKTGSKHNARNHPLNSQKLFWRKLQLLLKIPSSSFSSTDYTDNLTHPEFIPTKMFQLLEILNTYFPRHRLILSDYSALYNTLEGINAPMVQTADRRSMVPCTSYLLPPGEYDTVFPTNFELLKDMYLLTCRGTKAGNNEKNAKAIKYDDFLERYGDMEKSKNKKGAPLRFMHQPNVKVFLT